MIHKIQIAEKNLNSVFIKKKKILSLFIHPHVFSKPIITFFLLWKHKRWYFEWYLFEVSWVQNKFHFCVPQKKKMHHSDLEWH